MATHIGDLEAENSKVNIASASNFNVDHFEREGATSVNFGGGVDAAHQKKILDQTISDNRAKEMREDADMTSGKMSKGDHDRMHGELEQGIRDS